MRFLICLSMLILALPMPAAFGAKKPSCDEELTASAGRPPADEGAGAKPAPTVYTKDQVAERLRVERLPALLKAAAIKRAVAALSPEDAKFFAQTVKAIDAATGKHHREFERAENIAEMDTGRHFLILKEISAFDETKAKYSFYRIKRAIEGAFDIDEYVDCLTWSAPKKGGGAH